MQSSHYSVTVVLIRPAELLGAVGRAQVAGHQALDDPHRRHDRHVEVLRLGLHLAAELGVGQHEAARRRRDVGGRADGAHGRLGQATDARPEGDEVGAVAGHQDGGALQRGGGAPLVDGAPVLPAHEALAEQRPAAGQDVAAHVDARLAAAALDDVLVRDGLHGMGVYIGGIRNESGYYFFLSTIWTI